jgi:hypothetical protein
MNALLRLRLSLVLFLIGVLVTFYAIHYRSVAAGVWDFEEFYVTAQLLRHGDVSPLRHNIYPAVHALILLPLTWFPVKTAYLLWTTVNVCALLMSIRLLQRELRLGGGDWPLFAALLLPGVWACLLHGQFSLLILLLYSYAFVQMRRGNDFLAGILVGLGALKFHLVLGFVAIMVLRRGWRFVSGALIGGGVIFGCSAAIVGIQPMMNYPAVLRSAAYQPQLARPWMMVNLRGLLYGLARQEPSVWLVAAASIALLLCAAYSWREIDAGFPCAVLVSTITAYHAYAQELCLFIPFLAWVASDTRVSQMRALAILFGGAFLVCGLVAYALFPIYPLLALGLLVLTAYRRHGSLRSSPASLETLAAHAGSSSR